MPGRPVTRPLAVFRSTWAADPDFAMTYSYLRAGGSPADRDALAAPWRGLQVAGEATWSSAPGTMHGAWFSGERAARRVLAGEDGATPGGDLPVVVVGAGLAGIAAARLLRGAGRSVVVLEAGSVPLGRARGRSTPFGELLPGAMWLHGVDGHPLLSFVRAAGIELVADSWEVKEGDPANVSSPVFTEDGLLPSEFHGSEVERFFAIEAALDDGSAIDVPLGSRLLPILDGLEGVSRLVQETWFRTLYESLVAGSFSDLSLRHRHEEFLLGGADMMLASPLSAATGLLVDGIDVRLSSRVVSVSPSATGWRVATLDGSLEASSVVLTPSLEVLERLDVWSSFPAAMRSAASRIGRGREGKFFAVFEEAFWSPHRSFFLAVPGSPAGRVFVDASRVLGRPTLAGFAPFGDVERLEATAESDLVDELEVLLRPVARRG